MKKHALKIIILLGLFGWGCRTFPSLSSPLAHFLYLPQDGFLYAGLKITAQTKQLILGAAASHFAEAGDIKSILDRTRTVYLSLSAGPAGQNILLQDQPRRFVFLLEGCFPSRLISSLLGSRSDWQTVSAAGGSAYFLNTDSGLQIYVGGPGLIIVSNGLMADVLNNADTLVPLSYEREAAFRLLAEASEENAIALYFPPGFDDFVKQSLDVNISAQELVLTAKSQAAGFLWEGVFTLKSEGNTKGFTSVLRLLMVKLLKLGGVHELVEKIKQIEIVNEGRLVFVRGFEMSAGALEVFIATLLKTSP